MTRLRLRVLIALWLCLPLITTDLSASNLDSALIKAARSGNLEEVKRLVAEGASKNARMEKRDVGKNTKWIGRTPLMVAAGWNHHPIVAYLLDLGASPTISDRGGSTAWSLAFYFQCGESLKLLARKLYRSTQFEMKSGEMYEGTVNDENDAHGWGLLWVPGSGTRFEGVFQRGAQTGFGTLTFSDGGTWKGSFINGYPHGRVERTWPDGDKFIGSYEGPFERVGNFMVPGGRRRGFLPKKAVYTFSNGKSLQDREASDYAEKRYSEQQRLLAVRHGSSSASELTPAEWAVAGVVVLGAVALLKEAVEKAFESTPSSDGSTASGDLGLYIGSWGSWLKHSPLSGGEHREAWVRCPNGLSFEVEEHHRDTKHWFQRDAGAVLLPKLHDTLQGFILVECGEGSGLYDHDRNIK